MTDSSSPLPDVWANGAAYEAYAGRWSRAVAREFLAWLAVPPGRRWLDVGCGTGILSQAILQQADPAHLKGMDRSAGFIRFAQAQLHDDRAEFVTGDALALSDPAGTYDVVVSGLVLNFVPDPAGALREMVRATCSGGTVAGYVWDYAGRMDMMRAFWDAAAALDPQAQALDQGRRFPMCNPPALTALFQAAGLSHVETRGIDIPTDFEDFEDYWQPFLGGQGAAPTYLASLSEDHRNALREHLRQHLPFAADGSLRLAARSWAVQGSV